MESAGKLPRKSAVHRAQYFELASASVAPIGVGVINPAAGNQAVIYIGDAARSVLTLRLTNQTNTTLTLKGAASVPSDTVDAGATAAVYLDFRNLLDANELAGLSVSAGTSWRAVFFVDAKLWGLCPAADTALPVNAVLSITIDNLKVAKNPGGAALDVYYVNFNRPGQQFREVTLLIQNPPGDKGDANITAHIESDAGGDVVLISPAHMPPIQNAISVKLINGQGTPLQAGPDTMFYLSFVYGKAPGYGALMSIGSAIPDILLTQSGGDGWTVSADMEGKTPFWKLQPTGQVALGTGSAALVEFEISGVAVPPDFVTGATLLYVQWANLPGYRDGHTQVILQKLMPKPSVSVQPVTDIEEYGTNPILTWETIAVPYLQLSYSAYGKDVVFLPATESRPIPLQAPDATTDAKGFVVPDAIRANTTFYLRGYPVAPPPGRQPNVISIAEASCTVTVQHPVPIIKRFEAIFAQPLEIGPTVVTLKWEIDWIENLGQRSLILSGPGAQALSPGETSCTVPNIIGPQKWTLQATGSGGRYSCAEAEIRAQSVTDYLYRNPPRRFKGVGSHGAYQVTAELTLFDIKHNKLGMTVQSPSDNQAWNETYDATVEGNFLVIPSSGDPERRLHFRITPSVLTLSEADARRRVGMPATLLEENS
jgi:hypothetical protein